MSLTCTICSAPYYPHRHDYLDVCVFCLPNLRACVVHDPPDALQVDDDLATRLLLEQSIDEAQRHGQIQARGPRLWR